MFYPNRINLYYSKSEITSLGLEPTANPLKLPKVEKCWPISESFTCIEFTLHINVDPKIILSQLRIIQEQ